jgi:hypothetical protein
MSVFINSTQFIPILSLIYKFYSFFRDSVSYFINSTHFLQIRRQIYKFHLFFGFYVCFYKLQSVFIDSSSYL